jgi:hypothetical protein
MMHSLDGDVARHARICDAGRPLWQSEGLDGWAVMVVIVRINDVVSGWHCWCSGTCSFVGAWA